MFLEQLPEALGQLSVFPAPKGTQSFIFWGRGSLRVWGQLHKTKPPSQTATLAKGQGEPKSPPSPSLLGISHRVQQTLQSSGPRLHASHLQPSRYFPASPPHNTLLGYHSLATQPSLAPHYPRTNVLITPRASLSFPTQLPTLRSHLLLPPRVLRMSSLARRHLPVCPAPLFTEAQAQCPAPPSSAFKLVWKAHS